MFWSVPVPTYWPENRIRANINAWKLEKFFSHNKIYYIKVAIKTESEINPFFVPTPPRPLMSPWGFKTILFLFRRNRIQVILFTVNGIVVTNLVALRITLQATGWPASSIHGASWPISLACSRNVHTRFFYRQKQTENRQQCQTTELSTMAFSLDFWYSILFLVTHWKQLKFSKTKSRCPLTDIIQVQNKVPS